MSNLFVKFLFSWIAKKVDGYKMYILAAVAIMKGILGIIAIHWPEFGIQDWLTTGNLNWCLAEIWGGCLSIAGKSAIVKSTPCNQVGDGCSGNGAQ
jgi:hypothetical protein